MFPVLRVKYNGKRVRLAGFGPRKYQMFQFGQLGVKLIKDRVAKAIGSDDQPMRPLEGAFRNVSIQGKKVYRRGGYARYKARKGLKPIRDLWGPGKGGHMLDDLRVVYADTTTVRIDISRRLSRLKARANERRQPWYGWSRKDQAELAKFGASIFKTSIEEVRASFRGTGRQIFRPGAIWMDPLNMKRGIAAA